MPEGSTTTAQTDPMSDSMAIEPLYDKLLVGGTMSLGFMLWIGAIVIMVISLVDQSQYNTARVDDFVSLGPGACVVQSAASYVTRDVELNALNRLCVEQWEYNVQVDVTEDDANSSEHQAQLFVSDPQTFTACRTTCDQCPPDQFQGDQYYAGVDPTRRGQQIYDDIRVECWAPTLPVKDLSDYYDCGKQQNQPFNDTDIIRGDDNAATCYLLQDPSIELTARQDSDQIAMISAYVGLAGGCLLLLVAGWFVWRNRQEYDRRVKELLSKPTTTSPQNQQQQETQQETSNSRQSFDEEEGDEQA